jgi:hypothetical protein
MDPVSSFEARAKDPSKMFSNFNSELSVMKINEVAPRRFFLSFLQTVKMQKKITSLGARKRPVYDFTFAAVSYNEKMMQNYSSLANQARCFCNESSSNKTLSEFEFEPHSSTEEYFI